MLEQQINAKSNPHNRSMEEFQRHTNTKLNAGKNRSISQASNQQSADLLIKNSRFNTHATIEHQSRQLTHVSQPQHSTIDPKDRSRRHNTEQVQTQSVDRAGSREARDSTKIVVKN